MGQWGPAVDSEALMKFLNIHEPTLAAKLEDLQSDNPRQFKASGPHDRQALQSGHAGNGARPGHGPP